MIRRFNNWKKRAGGLLVGAAVLAFVSIGVERAAAFRGGGGFHGGGGGFHGGGFGGFHGGGGFGGFHGGGSRFGDGGFSDHSADAGFGRGGFGSVHNAGSYSDHADTYQQSHPEYQHNANQFQQTHPEGAQNASQLQQNRTNEANNLQSRGTTCRIIVRTRRTICITIAKIPSTTITAVGVDTTRAPGSVRALPSARRWRCCRLRSQQSRSLGTHTTMPTESITRRRAASTRWCLRRKARSLQPHHLRAPRSMSAPRPISTVAARSTPPYRPAIR